jgi:hypothetical protein
MEPLRRKLDRGDDFVMSKVSVSLGSFAGEAVKLGEGNRALAFRAGDVNRRLQHGKRHAHIRGMHGDARLAPAEDRVHAIEAVNSATA